MTDFPATDMPSDPPPSDAPKVRQCLRCEATFPSKWAGERICPRCKSSSTWRNGSPLSSHAFGTRR